jgi:hypothetical protein
MFSCLFNTNIRAIDEKTKNWVINNPKKSVMITLGGLGGISLSSVLMCNLIKSISNNFCKFNTDSYKIGQDGKVMANVLVIGSNHEKRNKLIDDIKNNYDNVGNKIEESFNIGPNNTDFDWGGNAFRVYDNNNFKFYANKNLNITIQNNGTLMRSELYNKWQECKEFVKIKNWNILSIDSNAPKLKDYIKNCFLLIYLPNSSSEKTRTLEMNQITEQLNTFNKNLDERSTHCKTMTICEKMCVIRPSLNPDEGFIWNVNNHKFFARRF